MTEEDITEEKKKLKVAEKKLQAAAKAKADAEEKKKKAEEAAKTANPENKDSVKVSQLVMGSRQEQSVLFAVDQYKIIVLREGR